MGTPMDDPAFQAGLQQSVQNYPAGQGQSMIQTNPGNVDQYLQNLQAMQSLGGSSADPEKRAALEKQIQMAEALRQGPNMPGGRYIPGYKGVGVYVAPSPLQDIARLAQYGYGMHRGQQAIEEEHDMATREAQNRTAIMEMINRQNLQPPMSEPDMSNLQNVQNPMENYNFNMGGGPPRNTNLTPQQAPPRQMTPDEFSMLQYPGG